MRRPARRRPETLAILALGHFVAIPVDPVSPLSIASWASSHPPPMTPTRQSCQWARLDSNQRTTNYEFAALPLSYGPARAQP